MANMLRVAELISGLDADLVGVSEYEPDQTGQLYDQVEESYPFYAFFPGLTDVGLLSRYPILEKQLIESPDLRSPLMRVVVDVQSVHIVVYVVHIISPKLTWPFTYDASKRDYEIVLVRNMLIRETEPVVVLCDCNMSDQSDAYRQLNRIMTDSFREAGHGMGFTFPDGRKLAPPLVRIDYIWHNDFFVSRKAYLLTESGTSDHRPVMAILALK